MRKKLLALIIALAMVFGLTACGSKELTTIGTVPDDISVNLTIAVCGDVMAHMPQLKSALQSDGSYDFNENYDLVRDIMQGADLCMANIECTFPGPDAEYTGYPAFKTPDSLATALANAGVDVGIFANNHMNDSGLSGAKRTRQVIESAGLYCVGCRESEDQNRSIIVPVKVGSETVNVGVVAYTYETSRGDTNRTMNGGAMSKDAPKFYNSFRQFADTSVLDKDIKAIKDEIAWCQERSDITIVYLHWGEEYQRHSNARQQYIAEAIAESRPDAIIASHPHVLQEISYVNSVPVYYSIGNYISNQCEETLDNHYTEQGLIAMLNFKLSKSPVNDGKYVIAAAGSTPNLSTEELTEPGATISGFDVYGTREECEAEEAYNKKLLKIFAKAPAKEEMSWDSWTPLRVDMLEAKACPTWVHREYSGGKFKYKIVPLLEKGYSKRADGALDDIVDLIGEEFIWNSK